MFLTSLCWNDQQELVLKCLTFSMVFIAFCYKITLKRSKTKVEKHLSLEVVTKVVLLT